LADYRASSIAWKNGKVNTLQNLLGTGGLLTGILLVVALNGCAISRQQPPSANASTNAAATPAAQATAQATRIKPATTRMAQQSAEATSKSSTAAILAQIHQADLREIAIGKVADEKASNSEVRDYADRLIKDHTAVDQAVAAAARTTKVVLHDKVEPRKGRQEIAHRRLDEEKLKSATGANFDRLFLQQTSADHDDLIRALKQEREDASDDAIEGLIDKILPIFEQHEELAHLLLKKEQA